MHHISYFVALAFVGLWTINIHDRTSLKIPFVNGSAHHTIHHTGFNYNYGQYFIFWDVIGGSFRDPFLQAPYNGKPLASGDVPIPPKTKLIWEWELGWFSFILMKNIT